VFLSGWSMNIQRMNPTILLVSTGGRDTIPISFSAIIIIKVLYGKDLLDLELTLSFYEVEIIKSVSKSVVWLSIIKEIVF
jgi:hypothetical protein